MWVCGLRRKGLDKTEILVHPRGMGGIVPLRDAPREPRTLHDRALENVRYIRETMERATSFTAVSGSGTVLVGVTALGAAFVASHQRGLRGWLLTWLVEAFLAVAAGGLAMARKARLQRTPLLSRPGRQFVLSLIPPMLCGALLTPVLIRAGVSEALPGTWLLLYGAGIVTGGAFSVPVFPAMGLCFMAAGAGAFLSPATWQNGFMAAGFGGIHIIFGILIARRHGG